VPYDWGWAAQPLEPQPGWTPAVEVVSENDG